MPIRVQDCEDNFCQGFEWEIEDREKLAKAVAHILVQQYSAAIRILTDSDHSAVTKANVESIIAERLKKSDTEPWHRDGLLFQLIAWLVAHKEASKGDSIALPHLIPAGKGIDGAVVHLNDDSGFTGISICEDKATDHARNVISTKVWPEIEACENGDKDDELRTFVINALVERCIAREQAEYVAGQILWKNQRRYRVRTTHTKRERGGLFKDFDEKVAGDELRRRGETLFMENLREWMDHFADLVKAELRKLAR